ncbi:hypothetical protein MRB53_038463 [Persea americana]|nr:hypothetical protein MRB53_038463 [Persea americana]
MKEPETAAAIRLWMIKNPQLISKGATGAIPFNLVKSEASYKTDHRYVTILSKQVATITDSINLIAMSQQDWKYARVRWLTVENPIKGILQEGVFCPAQLKRRTDPHIERFKAKNPGFDFPTKWVYHGIHMFLVRHMWSKLCAWTTKECIACREYDETIEVVKNAQSGQLYAFFEGKTPDSDMR